MEKKIIYTALILAFSFGCCKQEIPAYADPLVGSWGIDSMAYCARVISAAYDPIAFWTPMDNTDTIVFNDDGTGYFMNGIHRITDTVKLFTWERDTINNFINFSFINGTSLGIINSINNESMEMFLRDYLIKPNGSLAFFFYFEMIKTSNHENK